jgi:UDP-N-acetylglucosamine:LPS N-acetylglucosamine transferase
VVGSKRVKHLEKTLHVLNHSGLPLQMIVVTGGDEEMYRQFRRVEWHGVTQVYNLVENMADFLLAADLVLCKAGGLITTESLACGLPMLLIDVTPGQEEGNAEYVLKYGAADRAETPVDALETLFHWLHNDCALLTERAHNAKAIGKPRSAFQAAEIVMQLAESGPPAPPAERGILLPRLRELLAQFGISGEG